MLGVANEHAALYFFAQKARETLGYLKAAFEQEGPAMTTEDDVLMKQVKEALELRRQIDGGMVVLLKADKVQKAFQYMMSAAVTAPIKRWSENTRLWALAAIAGCSMFATVALSVLKVL